MSQYSDIYIYISKVNIAVNTNLLIYTANKFYKDTQHLTTLSLYDLKFTLIVHQTYWATLPILLTTNVISINFQRCMLQIAFNMWNTRHLLTLNELIRPI